MKKNDIQTLTLLSVFSAIILLMTFVPSIGYITFGPLSMTLIHIPVLIGVFLLPKRYSWILGLVFGVGSLVKAAVQPVGLLDPAFVNPLVSVLPRIAFVIAAAWLFELFKLIDRKLKQPDIYIFGFVSMITLFAVYYAGQAIVEQAEWNENWLIPILFVIIGLVMTAYYAFIRNDKRTRTMIPATFLISTIFHTIIVLSCLVIFEHAFITQYIPATDLLNVVYSTVVTNGLIEAVTAVLIGTPILYGLEKVMKR